MAILKPFKGIRPKKELANKIASKPYDVLNEKEARCLMLRAEGLSYQEIADQLVMPIGTVKSHVHRGMQMLRAQMKEV